MASPREYRYTVEGEGRFPLDMLRFDRAWPASETDSNTIGHALEDGRSSTWRVELVSKRKPTTGRWDSFNWRVLESRPY